MSELINNSSDRLAELTTFAGGLVRNEDGRNLVSEYWDIIHSVTPFEVMEVLDRLLQQGIPLDEVKSATGRIINAFSAALQEYEWELPAEDHFLQFLMHENREVVKLMDEMKGIIKVLFHEKKNDPAGPLAQLHQYLKKLEAYELHYLKKENILFPCIEKVFPGYRCLQIMWSFHDDFRKCLKSLDRLLTQPVPSLEEVNRLLGKLYFVVYPVIFREEKIVFPVAFKAVPPAEWNSMLQQSATTGWCYIDPPDYSVIPVDITAVPQTGIDLDTGILLPEQIRLLLNTLPVDITFIDDQDEVRYFSGSQHRIFPRAKAIIGRKVQNCHPPESVHVVNEIIDAFRNGNRDHADFWIQMKGRFIHIRYFAVLDENGGYKGTIEVSQDVTEIRNLEGEQRLLTFIAPGLSQGQ
ncbi:MAG: PAS domain-containing protein [Bacteroidales bacterium]